jgi:HK97 family phage major capsid protein
VAPTYDQRIVKKAYETTPMRARATIMTTSGDSIEFPSDPTDVTSGWVGEVETRANTDGPAPGLNRIPVQEVYAQVKVSQKLLDDAFFNLEAYLEARLGDKLGRTENAASIVGDGIKQWRGITKYDTAETDDSTRAWGTVEFVKSGASADFVADANSPADYLFTLVGKLKKNYLQGANWFFPRAVQAKIRKFKTTALGYIWEPSLKAGEPSQLLGYPVDLSEDMPALAASSLSLAFGNFAEAYTIVDRMGIRMIRDAVTAKGHVIFYVTKRSGGGMVNSEAYKLMKFIN